MARKFKNFLESVYGKQVKNRWKKIIFSIVVIIMTIGITIFVITNLGYDGKKFYIKPWNVDLKINKGIK